MKWSFVSLGDVLQSAEVFVDGDWVESKDQDINGDVRLIQLADIGDGYYIDKSSRFLTSDKAQELRCTFLEKGDVLVARMPEPLGRACIFLGDSKRSVTVVDICIIRPNRQHNDARWLMHCLNAPVCRNQMADFATGSTRTRISRGNLTKIKIPLPPIEEQKRIAEILDRTQSLISKRKEAIELLDTLTQSIFIEMFGDPVKNQKKWKVINMSECAEKIQIGPFGTQLHEEDYIDNGIPLINPTHIKDGKIFPNSAFSIPSEKHQQLSQYHLEINDVILGRRGEMGRCAIISENENGWLCGTGSLFIRPKQELLNSFYLFCVLSSQSIKKYLEKASQGVTMANLNKTIVSQIPMTIPSLPLQKEFAQRVEAIKKLKATHRASLTELQALFASLQHRAFRGEL